MNLRRRRPAAADVNLTPLIDVVFLLLIFFMVSTTFERESAVRVVLPDASPEPAPRRPETLAVTVTAAGRVYVDERLLPDARLATIRTALQEQSRGLDQPRVSIRAAATVSHQAVVTVMDAARRAGLVNITFATRARDEEAR